MSLRRGEREKGKKGEREKTKSRRTFPARFPFFPFSLSPFLLLCFIFALCVGAAFAQKPLLRRYDVADGLANSVVVSVYQDKKGFVWFATWEGLSRFDGYEFVNYGVRDGLGQQIVNHVAEDRNGRLWAATNGGGVSLLIDRQIDVPQSLKVRAKQKFISFSVGNTPDANRVNRIYFDSNNNLWCLTDFGLYRTAVNDLANLKFEPVIEKKSGNSHALMEDKRGRMWCGLDTELFEIADGQIINHGAGDAGANTPTGGSGEPGNFITGIVETADGKLLVSTFAALYEINSADGANERGQWLKQPLPLGEALIYLMFRDSSRNLWLGAGGKASKTIRLDEQNQISEFLGIAHPLKDIIEDAEGNLWFATHGGGVYKYGGAAFVSYFSNATDSVPLVVGGVFETDDGKIFGVLNDKSLVEITDGQITPRATIDYIPSLTQASFVRTTNGKLQWNAVSFGATNISQFAVRLRGGADVGLKKFLSEADLETGVYFYEDERNALWLFTAGKEIYRLDADADSLTRVASAENPLFRNLHPQIVSDRRGGLWFSDRLTLCRLRDRTIKCFEPTSGLPAVEPRSLFVDSRGWLWVGLRFDGAAVVKNPQDDAPQFVNFADELPSRAVWAMTEDDAGKMYFGTERGVAQFDAEKNLWRHFNSKNGLSGDRVNGLMKDSRGNIWIPTVTGLTRFDPQAERGEDKPPPIYLNRVQIAGEDLPVAEAGASEIPLVELAAASDNLTIGFVGLNFADEDSLKYQFKLEGGGDADWSAPTKQRVVNYARLGAGDYRFLVRAVNRRGAASVTPAAFRFRIAPPVYLRPWFLLLTAILIGGAGYLFYKNRLNRLLELERVRTRIATDLHDDIGANLTRISLLSEVARQKADNGEGELLASIADISRESVASMNDIVWAIAPEHDSLLDLTRRMRRHAEEVFALCDVALEFRAPADDADLRLSVGARRDLLLIFKEGVNNAARHADCQTMRIDFRRENQILRLTIKDDGRGFDAAAKVDGQGLRSMKKRAAALGGKLAVESGRGAGTVVELILPLARTRSNV